MKICFNLKVLLAICIASPSYALNRNQIVQNLNLAAQLEFLDSDLIKAKNTYLKITEMSLDQAWTKDVREIIYQAYFRLAQLEKNQSEKWVLKAITYAPDLEPDLELTPKNLVTSYNKLKKDASFIKINSTKNKTYLINGSNKIAKVHKDKIYRIDDISNPFSEVRFIKGHLIDGFNSSVITSAQNKKNEHKNHTPKQSTEIKLATYLPQKKLFRPQLELNLNNTPNGSKNLNIDFAQLKNQIKHKKVKKRNNTWIYIASTIVAVTLGAVLISNNNDNSKAYEPSQSKEF